MSPSRANRGRDAAGIARRAYDSEAPTQSIRPAGRRRKPEVTLATLDEMVELLQHELTSAPPGRPRHTPMRFVLRSGPVDSPRDGQHSAAALPPPPRVPATYPPAVEPAPEPVSEPVRASPAPRSQAPRGDRRAD